MANSVQPANLPTGMSLGPFAQTYGAGLLAPWTSTTGMQLGSLMPAGMTETGKTSSYYNPSTWGVPQYQAPAGGNQDYMTINRNLQGMVPESQTASQMTAAALQADALLPENMRLSAANNTLSPDARAKFENDYMAKYANPAEGKLSSQLYSHGRMDSTFGGAQMGQMQSMNQLNKFNAGETARQNSFNDFLNLRSNFFGNEGQMAQNANSTNVQRGLGLANSAMNAYAQQSNQQNQFNLNAYDQMLRAQGQRENMQYQQIQSINQNRQEDRAFKPPQGIGMGVTPGKKYI